MMLTYLSFLLLSDQSLNSNHRTRLSLIDANEFWFQRELCEGFLDSYTAILWVMDGTFAEALTVYISLSR